MKIVLDLSDDQIRQVRELLKQVETAPGWLCPDDVKVFCKAISSMIEKQLGV